MEFLLFTASICIFILSGLIALSYIEKGVALGFGMWARLAVSFMLGLGIISMQMFIYTILSIPFSFFNITVIWIVLTTFSCLSHDRRNLFSAHFKAFDISCFHNLKWHDVILLLIVVLQVIYTFMCAFLMPLNGWDALEIWFLKARGFFMEKKVSPEFLLNASSHADYPLLIPLSVAWIYTSMGKLNDHMAKVMYPLQYVSLLIIFHYLLKKISSRNNALLFTTLLSLTPMLVLHAGGFPAMSVNLFVYDYVGYADITLSIYFISFCGFLYLFLLNQNYLLLTIAVLFLGMGAWTKNEGLTFALIGACLIAQYLSGELKRRLLTISVILAVFVLPWLAYRLYFGIPGEYFSNLNFYVILDNISRLSVIVNTMGKSMFVDITLFSFIWYGYILTSLVNWRGFLHRPLFVLQTMLLSQCAIYIFIYMISPHDIVWHLTTSVDRLIFHLTPLALFIAGINVWQKIEPADLQSRAYFPVRQNL
ncbi:MAG: hypothetical protein HZB54_03820 [Deltaproteobacteria bacterium]|nr:hypothetical protein [Deltaproteobacteria bacterium]